MENEKNTEKKVEVETEVETEKEEPEKEVVKVNSKFKLTDFPGVVMTVDSITENPDLKMKFIILKDTNNNLVAVPYDEFIDMNKVEINEDSILDDELKQAKNTLDNIDIKKEIDDYLTQNSEENSKKIEDYDKRTATIPSVQSKENPSDRDSMNYINMYGGTVNSNFGGQSATVHTFGESVKNEITQAAAVAGPVFGTFRAKYKTILPDNRHGFHDLIASSAQEFDRLCSNIEKRSDFLEFVSFDIPDNNVKLFEEKETKEEPEEKKELKEVKDDEMNVVQLSDDSINQDIENKIKTTVKEKTDEYKKEKEEEQEEVETEEENTENDNEEEVETEEIGNEDKEEIKDLALDDDDFSDLEEESENTSEEENKEETETEEITDEELEEEELEEENDDEDLELEDDEDLELEEDDDELEEETEDKEIEDEKIESEETKEEKDDSIKTLIKKMIKQSLKEILEEEV